MSESDEQEEQKKNATQENMQTLLEQTNNPNPTETSPPPSSSNPADQEAHSLDTNKNQNGSEENHRKTDLGQEFIAINYFSIGIAMLLEFETLRKESPHLFVAREVNFLLYGLIGLKNMVGSYQSLRHFIQIIVDEKPIKIPHGICALVIHNVPSYSGGTNPWQNASNADEVPGDKSQSICDGTLEIFGMKGAYGKKCC